MMYNDILSLWFKFGVVEVWCNFKRNLHFETEKWFCKVEKVSIQGFDIKPTNNIIFTCNLIRSFYARF